MWSDLPKNQRDRYKKLITNFASLSEAFTQKMKEEDVVNPIISSKFQEKAFQTCFKANAEDISNTSFDSSIDLNNREYLIGIKTFRINSRTQKVAQFKSMINNWGELSSKLSSNADGLSSKEDIDKVNHSLYEDFAEKIAFVRNERIESSKSNLRGFKVNDHQTESVYHVLMSSYKDENPSISIGETTYEKIDIHKIKILGCTDKNHPQNFKFTDGKHKYQYNSADSQLLMDFNNKKIILETWPINYVKDAVSFFERIDSIAPTIATVPNESHSWFINVKPFSGFNLFYGQSKYARKNNAREKWIDNFNDGFSDKVDKEDLTKIDDYLASILLTNWQSDTDKETMAEEREELMKYIVKLDNKELTECIRGIVYRPVNELEIRIPNSTRFHKRYPNFFIDQGYNPESSIEDRTFKLKFIPSGDVVDAYIGESEGKAFKTLKTEKILGKWVLRDVFQLKEYERLTQEKLNELGINGLRLTKKDGVIELEFIWIDSDNPPEDLWK